MRTLGKRVSAELAREYGGAPVWAIAGTILVVLSVTVLAAVGRLTPPAVTQYSPPKAAPTVTLPAPKFQAVFLGDDYSAGTGGEGVRWPDIVGDALGWDVQVRALGGTGYIQTAGPEGCGRDHCGNYLEAADEIIGTPDVIVVSGGRNDPDDDVGIAADELFAELRERYPLAMIVILSPWFDDDAVPPSLTNKAESIRLAAERAGVEYVNAGNPLTGHPEWISSDGVHPNAMGYRVLAEIVIDRLSSLPDL